jgi:hypothetical protein
MLEGKGKASPLVARVALLAAAVPTALVLVGLGWASGCSSTSNPPLTPLETDGSAETSVFDAGPKPDVNGEDAGLGLGVSVVPDAPCVPKGGVSPVLYGPEAGAPAPSLLVKVGAGRAAQGSSTEGFVTFDADGANPSPMPTAMAGSAQNLLTSTGNALVLAGDVPAAPDHIIFQRFDATGASFGVEDADTNEESRNFTTGASGAQALLAWAGPNAVRAAGVDMNGALAGPVYDLAVTYLTANFSAAITDDGNGSFAVAFAGSDTGSRYQTVFALGTATKRLVDPVELFTGPRPVTAVQMVRTPEGCAILLAAGGSDHFALLVFVDPTGTPLHPGIQLGGSSTAYGLAVQGSEVGVLTRGTSGTLGQTKHTVRFRAFDLTGAPLGSWVCLDTPANDPNEDGAIDADGTGYAVIYRAPDGSDVFVRFDHLGTGNP